MGKHAKQRKKLTRFDLRFYRYWLLVLYIRLKREWNVRVKHGRIR